MFNDVGNQNNRFNWAGNSSEIECLLQLLDLKSILKILATENADTGIKEGLDTRNKWFLKIAHSCGPIIGKRDELLMRITPKF